MWEAQLRAAALGIHLQLAPLHILGVAHTVPARINHPRSSAEPLNMWE